MFPNRYIWPKLSQKIHYQIARLLNIVEYGASNVSPECENTGEDSHSSGEETAY